MLFSVKLTILSDTKYLVLLRQLISAVGSIVGEERFPASAHKLCALCLIEAVDNAIFHAHDSQIKQPIDVMVSVGNSALTMTVVDKGRGFDFAKEKLPDPDLLSTGGRGLFLIQTLMNKVESRLVEQGHEMVMTYDFNR